MQHQQAGPGCEKNNRDWKGDCQTRSGGARVRSNRAAAAGQRRAPIRSCGQVSGIRGVPRDRRAPAPRAARGQGAALAGAGRPARSQPAPAKCPAFEAGRRRDWPRRRQRAGRARRDVRALATRWATSCSLRTSVLFGRQRRLRLRESSAMSSLDVFSSHRRLTGTPGRRGARDRRPAAASGMRGPGGRSRNGDNAPHWRW